MKKRTYKTINPLKIKDFSRFTMLFCRLSLQTDTKIYCGMFKDCLLRLQRGLCYTVRSIAVPMGRKWRYTTMKPVLTINELIKSARNFCEIESKKNHAELIGVTDGKKVGTYVEHKFQYFLQSQYTVEVGSSAKGIDLPGADIQTDIKVTSITQPQSSCPFKNARQKIFGLGYNLLVFVYDKQDTNTSCTLHFTHCTFIDKERTADFTITMRLREMVHDGANKEDIIGFLQDKNVPGDEIIYNEIAEEILDYLPEQGYLTISNALQWRLQYARVITLDNHVDGIVIYEW